MEDFQKMFPDTVNKTVPQLLFRLFDKEGNGVLDWKTLMLAVGQQKSDIPPQDMFNLAFEIFDAVVIVVTEVALP
jgi:Ca2+-binding EF-hand superfamily protein